MQNKTDDKIYAGFFVRLAAYIIDVIIVGIALLAIRIPIWIIAMGNPDNIIVKDLIFEYSIADIVIYVCKSLYFVLLTYYTGATLGKKLFCLKVVSTEGRRLTFFEVAFRETVGRFLSGLIMNIGYILIVLDKEKRGLHDFLSDTEVIYYHEKKVYTHANIQYNNVYGNNGYGNAYGASKSMNNAEDTAEAENKPVEQKEKSLDENPEIIDEKN